MPRGSRPSESGSRRYGSGTQWLIYEQASLRAARKAMEGHPVVFAIFPEPPHPDYPLTEGGILHTVAVFGKDRENIDALPPQAVLMPLEQHAKDLYALTSDPSILERYKKLEKALEGSRSALDAHLRLYDTIFRDLGLDVDVKLLDEVLHSHPGFWRLVRELLKDPRLIDVYNKVVEGHPVAKKWGFRPGVPLVLLRGGKRFRIKNVVRSERGVELWLDKRGRQKVIITEEDLSDERRLREKLKGIRVSGPLLPIALTAAGIILLNPGEQYVPLSRDIARALREAGADVPEPEIEVIPPGELEKHYRKLIEEMYPGFWEKHEEVRRLARAELKALERIREILEKKIEDFLTEEERNEIYNLRKSLRKERDPARRRELKERIKRLEADLRRRAIQKKLEKIKEIYRNVLKEENLPPKYVREVVSGRDPERMIDVLRKKVKLMHMLKPKTYPPINLLTLYLLGVLHREVGAPGKAG